MPCCEQLVLQDSTILRSHGSPVCDTSAFRLFKNLHNVINTSLSALCPTLPYKSSMVIKPCTIQLACMLRLYLMQESCCHFKSV